MDSRIITCYALVTKAANARKAINVIDIFNSLLGIISCIVPLVYYFLAYENKWWFGYFLDMFVSNTGGYVSCTGLLVLSGKFICINYDDTFYLSDPKQRKLVVGHRADA